MDLEKDDEIKKWIEKASMIAIARMLLRENIFSVSEYNKLVVAINKKYKTIDPNHDI